jgi:hypothetical protein
LQERKLFACHRIGEFAAVGKTPMADHSAFLAGPATQADFIAIERTGAAWEVSKGILQPG